MEDFPLFGVEILVNTLAIGAVVYVDDDSLVASNSLGVY